MPRPPSAYARIARLCCCSRVHRFHIPPKPRLRVVWLLVGNVFFQYFTQACRFAWISYPDSQTLLGAIFINTTFVGGIVCGIVSGVLQGKAEGAVREENPGKFPPTPLEIALLAWRNERDRIREEMRKAGVGGGTAPAAQPMSQGQHPGQGFASVV